MSNETHLNELKAIKKRVEEAIQLLEEDDGKIRLDSIQKGSCFSVGQLPSYGIYMVIESPNKNYVQGVTTNGTTVEFQPAKKVYLRTRQEFASRLVGKAYPPGQSSPAVS
jgi:hypothetical protein